MTTGSTTRAFRHTSHLGGDPISGLQDLSDFALQVPTVALALAIGVIATERWRAKTMHAAL